LEAVVLEHTKRPDYASCFDRAWFFTLAHTGIRISELLDLRLEDVNVEAGYITVRGTKSDRDRIVYMTMQMQDALDFYLEQRIDVSETDHFFVRERGQSPTSRTMLRRLRQLGQLAGVDVTPHKLRHTLATRLTNRGMPIESLQKLMGHRHIHTTQIYAHVYNETVHAQFIDAMANVAKPLQSKMGRSLRQSMQLE